MPMALADDKYFTTRLTLSPAGDELTLDFAKALLDKRAARAGRGSGLSGDQFLLH